MATCLKLTPNLASVTHWSDWNAFLLHPAYKGYKSNDSCL